jgi:hypothetical protein
MTSAGQIHHKNPKTQLWHYSGNVKLETEKKSFFLAILMLMLLG